MSLDNFPYVAGQPAEIYHNGKWHRGKIYPGYRFQDGIVTVQTEDGKKTAARTEQGSAEQRPQAEAAQWARL